MKIHFEVLSMYEQKAEPVMVSVPFAKGTWTNDMLPYAAVKLEGKGYPAQFQVTGTWEDGSIKWLLINFLADLPANRAIDYELALEKEVQPSLPSLVKENRDGLTVDTGALRADLALAGSRHLFNRIEAGNCVYGSGVIDGPWLTDSEGERYCLQVGPGGWEVVESGPVRAVLRTRGKHVHDSGKTWFDYDLFVYAYRDKPWLRFEYQFINAEEDRAGRAHYALELNAEAAGFKYSDEYAYEMVKEIEVKICPLSSVRSPGSAGRGSADGESADFRHTLFTSGFHHSVMEGNQEKVIRHCVTADTIIETASEMFPEVLFGVYGIDWVKGERALTAGIYQAFQNFPKALESTSEGIRLKLMPEECGSLLKVPQGAARTSRFHLVFRAPETDEKRIVDRELMFQMPAVPTLDPQVYIDAGVFGNFVSNQYHHATERFLYRYVDSRAKGLGMMNFGDGPEWEYMKQGRSKGRDVWINNEYDMPHNFMLMFARTGDRRYFDYLKASAEHWFDVDLCHFSPNPQKQGLLYTHSVEHVTGQPVPSHQWVEGFLDYYHLTGNRCAYEAAMSIGEALLGLMKLPLYQTAGMTEPREIGWAMRTFLAMYRETHEERWLDACAPIAEVYLRWAGEYGSWTSPFPDNHMTRVPFMIDVGIAGLAGYDQLRPDARIKKTILEVVDDMIRECYVERAGTFYGKQAPPVRYLNLNGMVLQSLAIAYELSGNRRYIDAGMGMFQWISVENPPPLYDFTKVKRDEFTVIYDCPAGPKRCAQTLGPFLQFYKHVMDLDILPPGF